MAPEDVLTTMAQLGVAIAGFNGVATALQAAGRSTVERRISESVLVMAASVVVVWSVAAVVLLATPLPSGLVWRGLSLSWAIYMIAMMLWRSRQGRSADLDAPLWYRLLMGGIMAAVALQLWNGLVLAEAWPHLVGVAVNLVVALIAFFLIVHDDSPPDQPSATSGSASVQ